MADFASALTTRLEGLTALSAIAGDRIHWVNVPSDTPLPYVRLQTVSDIRPETLKGYQGFRPTRIQADFFSKRYGETRQMAEQTIAGLRAPAQVDGVQFGHTKAEGPRDLGEETTEGFVHRASVDLLVWHSVV